MKLNFWSKEKPPEKPTNFVYGQTRDAIDSTFVFNYVPSKFDFGLYRLLREAIPMFDVVPTIYSRLVGDFTLYGSTDAETEELNRIKNDIRVNHYQKGLHSCLWQARDSAISLGFGIFEIVPEQSFNDINRLKNVKSDDCNFIKKDDGSLAFGQMQNNSFKPVELQDQDYIKYLAYDLRDGHPQGYPIYYSLPFVGEIYTHIQQSIKNTIDRIGNPSFIVYVSGGQGQSEGSVAKIAEKLQDSLYNVFKYKAEGKNRDIAAGVPNGGAIEIKILGADGQLIDLEWPLRSVMEQMIAKLEIPAFMFSLYKWDNRQTMSGDQRDMLIAKVQGMRNIEEPIIRDVIDLKLILSGSKMKYKFEWNDMPLSNEEEAARAWMLEESALEKHVNYLEKLYNLGMMDEQELIQNLGEAGIISGKMSKLQTSKLLEKVIKSQEKSFYKRLVELT